MGKESTKSSLSNTRPILDSKGKTIGDINVHLKINKNSRSQDEANVIEVYREFCRYLPVFYDQVKVERYLWDNFGEKIDSFYKKEVEDKKLDKYSLDIETAKVAFDPWLKLHPVPFYFYHHEDLFFEILEVLGPHLLFCPSGQRLFTLWVESGQYENINRFCRILKKYSLKSSFYPPIKITKGEPGRAILKDFSPEYVKAYYEDIVVWLKNAKKNRTIDQNTFNEWSQRLETIKRLEPNKPRRYSPTWSFIEKTGYWILRVIEFKPGLKENFYTYEWTSHEMAKSILAKFFGVSEETIRSILYRKKSK